MINQKVIRSRAVSFQERISRKNLPASALLKKIKNQWKKSQLTEKLLKIVLVLPLHNNFSTNCKSLDRVLVFLQLLLR